MRWPWPGLRGFRRPQEESVSAASQALRLSSRRHAEARSRARGPRTPNLIARFPLEATAEAAGAVHSPSSHPEGDRYLWHHEPDQAGGYSRITELDREELAHACRSLATAALIATRLPPVGGRHDFALALAGFLLKDDRMGKEDTLRLMDAAWSVAGGAGQEARRDLIGIIGDTARKVALGAEVVGGGRLQEISPSLPRLLSRWWGWTPEHARGKADGVSEERGRKKLPSAFPSAAELMAREISPVRWVVPGMVPEGVALLAGKPKLGKAQPIDANVLTPTGWRAMRELGVGDEIIGSNGKPTRVSAVYPQGIQRRYTITVTGGYSVEATEDYLWNVQTHNDRTQGRGFRTLSTGEIAAGLRKGKVRDAYLPTVRPVEFGPVTQDLPLDPYLLGLLLGDGSLTKNVTLTSRDEELFEEADRRLPQGALLRSYRLLGMLG